MTKGEAIRIVEAFVREPEQGMAPVPMVAIKRLLQEVKANDRK